MITRTRCCVPRGFMWHVNTRATTAALSSKFSTTTLTQEDELGGGPHHHHQPSSNRSELRVSLLIDGRVNLCAAFQELKSLGLQVEWEPTFPLSMDPLTFAHASRHALAPFFRERNATTAGLRVPTTSSHARSLGGLSGVPSSPSPSSSVVIELVELPWLTWIREKVFRRPPRARILALASASSHRHPASGLVVDDRSDNEESQVVLSWSSLSAWVTRDDPPPLPAVHFSPSSSSSSSPPSSPSSSSSPPPSLSSLSPSSPLGLMGLREVVLGVASTEQQQLQDRLRGANKTKNFYLEI